MTLSLLFSYFTKNSVHDEKNSCVHSAASLLTNTEADHEQDA